MKYAILDAQEELIPEINLDFNRFIKNLSKKFDRFIDFSSIDDLLENRRDDKISEILDQPFKTTHERIIDLLKVALGKDSYYNQHRSGLLNGGIYKIENDEMKELRLENFLSDIASYIEKDLDDYS
jgi:hypothetical protein